MASKTILLIEDNKDILENLTEYFELENYKILAAGNGRRGLELAGQFIPDLIICDFFMPRMNGNEVLHLLLNKRKTSGIPFIFSTSVPEIQTRMSALKSGADEYIVKPYELEILLDMVQAVIKTGKNQYSVCN